MKDRIDKLMRVPWIAHVLRMNARFANRLGNQFAGAITYFSVLAIVPVIMFAFSVFGMIVGVFRPDLADPILNQIDANFGQGGTGVKDLVVSAFRNWGTIGIIGLLTALYAGAGWIANLKSAVRAQWQPDLEVQEQKHNIVVETLINMAILLGLMLVGVVSFAAANIGTSLNGMIIDLLNLRQTPLVSVLTWLASFVITLLVSWLLFVFVFWVMPQQRAAKGPWLRGAVIGAVGMTLLQSLAGLLFGSFSKNAAAALFGPVIVLMLFFNLFARLVLYIAAWIATANQPAVARRYALADEPLRGQDSTNAVEGHWDAADEDRREQERKKERAEAIKRAKADGGPLPGPDDREDNAARAYERQAQRRAGQAELAPEVEAEPEPAFDPAALRELPPTEHAFRVNARAEAAKVEPITPQAAARGVKIGTATGYAVGAATGVGLGAVLARLVAAIAGRRRAKK